MTQSPPVSYSDMVRAFGRIGVTSFGGPAAQIGLMHKTLVDEQRWLSEEQFLRALSFCMLLPGPEAMQLATYAGWRLRGIPGGLIAGLLFVLPGALVIAVLALLYARFGSYPETEALLLGVKACVVVIVAQALLGLSRKALTSRRAYWLAGLSFLAIFFFGVPFPVIIAIAAFWGAFTAAGMATRPDVGHDKRTSWAVLAGWTGLWLLPLPLLWALGQKLLFDLAAFFAKLAVVTFGGAYAVLAYMSQEVVQHRGWLTTGQMVDALGLAETTPGPLILVTQFVGMLAGYQAGQVPLALLAGAIALWMTFVPCFLWIFAGAPYVESLLHKPRLQAALSGITAAVVGVILNLSVWFALHVFFRETTRLHLGPVEVPLPVWSSLNGYALPLVALAAVCLGHRKCGVLTGLFICAIASWGLHQL